MDNLYSSFYLYRKYEIIGDELVDLGITSIDADGTQEPVMKEECDPACGCIPPDPVYRWVQTEDTICVEGVQRQTSGTPYCVGYDKYVVVTVEESFDSGTTWEFVSSSSTLVEADSPDCGYVPPTPVPAKFRLTLSDSSTVSAECDSTSAITQAETSAYTSTTVSAEIGDCVTTLGDYVFYQCRSLTSIDIPDSVTSIGNYVFYQCTSLTSIDIPDSVTSIGYGTFNQCSSLTSIEIPSGVTSIGDYAFQSCTSLTSVTVNATTPPTLGTSVFDNTTSVFDNTNNCPIYVPSGSVNAYKSETNWSTYASRIQAIP